MQTLFGRYISLAEHHAKQAEFWNNRDHRLSEDFTKYHINLARNQLKCARQVKDAGISTRMWSLI